MADKQMVDDATPENALNVSGSAMVVANPPENPTIEQRIADSENLALALREQITQAFSDVNARLMEIIAHVSSDQPQPSPVYRYDGPSSEIQFTIKQGEEFLMTDRLAQLFNPLLANGHQFTRVS